MPRTDPHLATARAVARELRKRIMAAVRKRPKAQRLELARLVRDELRRAEPLLAAAVRDGQLFAFIDAARRPAGRELPAIAAPATASAAPGQAGQPPASVPSPRTPQPIRLYPSDPFPTIPDVPPVRDSLPRRVLPQIEHAAHYLRTRLAYTPAEMAQLGTSAARTGFTVARAASLDAVQRVQRAVEAAVADGTTNREFRRAVREAIDASTLADHQVETLFRTHVGRAYSAGQLAVLDTPLVGDEFPYVEYSATHDARVRPEHLAMEKLGLNGTAVYRADDPVIRRFWPPWAWNCRCIVIPLSIEDAARKGVKEAIEWQRTGQPPARPEYVAWPSFDLPKGWVPVTTTLEPVLGA